MPLLDSMRLTWTSTACKERLIVLQEAKRLLLSPLCESVQEGFGVQDRSSKMWRYVPELVSYCCDILEERDMLAVLYWIPKSRPCICCHSTVEDFRHLWNREVCDLTEAKAEREYVRDKEREAVVRIVQRNRDAHWLLLDHG